MRGLLLLVLGSATGAAEHSTADPAAVNITGQYHWSNNGAMGIAVTESSSGSFLATCAMFGVNCPGRPGAPGDGGNWSRAVGTVDSAGNLAAHFDYQLPKGWNDTGVGTWVV